MSTKVNDYSKGQRQQQGGISWHGQTLYGCRFVHQMLQKSILSEPKWLDAYAEDEHFIKCRQFWPGAWLTT